VEWGRGGGESGISFAVPSLGKPAIINAPAADAASYFNFLLF